jgi:hypothetical protein
LETSRPACEAYAALSSQISEVYPVFVNQIDDGWRSRRGG